jgi:hypothetical protein
MQVKNKGKYNTSANQKSIIDPFPTVATAKENFYCNYVKWVMVDNMPLKSGESSAFKDMIPDYKSTIDMLTAKKLQAMAKLKAAVKGKYFYLTADHWTVLANENFGAIMPHFIVNFELNTHVLSCAKHENGASAKEVENPLVSDMHSWELE